MTFRQVGYIFLLVLVGLTNISYAQRSVVFLPQLDNTHLDGDYDRPAPRIKHLKSFGITQSIEPHPSSPSDFPNINITSFLLADQDEPSIAINPANPNNILLGCNDYRSDTSLWYFATTDGGVHWSGNSLVSDWSYAANPSDPAMTFNDSGTAFFSYGRIAAGFVPAPLYNLNDVVCFRSSDLGNSWSDPLRVIVDSSSISDAGMLADKYYIAADRDPSSPFFNRLYLTWVIYQNGINKIVVSHSTDNGASWTLPLSITAFVNFQCPIPVVAPNGNLYVSYEDIDPTHRQIHCAKSTDGGVTFSSDVIITSYNELGPLYPAGGPYAHPVIKGHVRVNSFPSIAIDGSSLHHGRIYLTYAGLDANNRAHIYLSISDDGSSHWTSPIAIENDLGSHATDKFFPWIAVDQSNGDIGIVCYDSRNDSLANEQVDAYLLFSHDGGTTFTPLRLTDVSFGTHASSSRDSVGGGPSDSLEFIGDYLALDAANKHWYPAWTDMRIGYDQDIYIAIVRPYAPSAPKNFQVVEDTQTHFANLSWSYDALTTSAMSLPSFQFHLRRTDDGALDTMLAMSDRSFVDPNVLQTSNYTYTLQVVASDDTSSTAIATFYPRALWESPPIELVSAQTITNGFNAQATIALKALAGTPLHSLYKIYYIIDGIPLDSGLLNDIQIGKTITPSIQVPAGFHKFEMILSTKLPDGDTVCSAPSSARWLYAGDPQTDYQENFSSSKNIFTPFGWDTTSANGLLPSRFINDSLPFVNYQSNENTWFALPAVAISDHTKTLEFDHIAAVASFDSAIVEYSVDDGVHYQGLADFNAGSYPNKWSTSLAGSEPVHEALSFSNFNTQNIITRFRLVTYSSGGDGWFIGNLKYSDAASVLQGETISNLGNITFNENPVTSDTKLTARLTLEETAAVTATVYDILGRERADLIRELPLQAGEYEISIPHTEAGTYLLVCREKTPNGARIATGRFTVLQ